jgi:hypothetical protein
MNKEKQPGKGNAIYNKYLIKAAIKNNKLQFIEIK